MEISFNEGAVRSDDCGSMGGALSSCSCEAGTLSKEYLHPYSRECFRRNDTDCVLQDVVTVRRTMSNEGFTLSEIIGDLSTIVEMVADYTDAGTPASYDVIQQKLSGELSLHLLSYVRFLETHRYLAYDRVRDEMSLTDEGARALEEPEEWVSIAKVEFAEHLVDEGGEDEPDDEPATGAYEVSQGSDFAKILGDFDFDAMTGEASDALLSKEQTDESINDDVVSGTTSMPMDNQGPVTTLDNPLTGQEPMTNSSFISDVVASASASSLPSSSGRTVSMEADYERIEEIGTGGIGTVFRARQVRLNRDVAVKEVRDIFSVFAGVQREDIIARFTSIIQTQATILHPNIVQVIDISTETEFPFVATQYAPNGNLRRLIDTTGRPPLGVSLKYFLQILHGLNAAHDKGIMHGSLKPENVVLDASGNALLTDFGISRVVERDGGKGNQVYVGVGTVAYMSPEQFQNPNLATVKSDIYSLGIMLYEMLTGKVPGRRSPMPSSFYPDIPRTLDDIFDKMSMDREEDRYGSIDEIIAELYEADEVMDILDKRSGVLFLRDPLQYGELGIAGLELPAYSPAPAVTRVATQVAEPQVYEPVVERHEEAAPQDLVYEASDVELGDDVSSEAEVSEAGDDVLDKLNKYGSMFDDED